LVNVDQGQTLASGICFGKILNKQLVQQEHFKNTENNELVVYTVLTHFIKTSSDHLAGKINPSQLKLQPQSPGHRSRIRTGSMLADCHASSTHACSALGVTKPLHLNACNV
jgi:hypothetical protein